MDCQFCNNELNVSDIERRNHTFTASCKTCRINYSLDKNRNIVNIQKRFAHHKTSWHMTYHPNDNKTTIVKVKRPILAGSEYPIDQEDGERYTLEGLVLPDRFLNLLAFL